MNTFTDFLVPFLKLFRPKCLKKKKKKDVKESHFIITCFIVISIEGDRKDL